MDYNINELIDYNINIIKQTSDVYKLELRGLDGKILNNEMCLTLFEKLSSESLVGINTNGKIYLLSKAFEIINYGGWIKYLTETKNTKNEIDEKNRIRENLEIDLAKSNIEANKLNREVSERNAKSERFNKIMSIFNFIFVIINCCMLIWQIIKS